MPQAAVTGARELPLQREANSIFRQARRRPRVCDGRGQQETLSDAVASAHSRCSSCWGCCSLRYIHVDPSNTAPARAQSRMHVSAARARSRPFPSLWHYCARASLRGCGSTRQPASHGCRPPPVRCFAEQQRHPGWRDASALAKPATSCQNASQLPYKPQHPQDRRALHPRPPQVPSRPLILRRLLVRTACDSYAPHLPSGIPREQPQHVFADVDIASSPRQNPPKYLEPGSLQHLDRCPSLRQLQ